MSVPGPRLDDLRTVSLFRGFNDGELGEIAALFQPVQPRASGVVFEVDEPATELYLLAAGEVVLERPATTCIACGRRR